MSPGKREKRGPGGGEKDIMKDPALQEIISSIGDDSARIEAEMSFKSIFECFDSKDHDKVRQLIISALNPKGSVKLSDGREVSLDTLAQNILIKYGKNGYKQLSPEEVGEILGTIKSKPKCITDDLELERIRTEMDVQIGEVLGS